MPTNQARRETPRMTDTSPRLIKKYPNRRLYDTASSSYVALADIKQLVMSHAAFRVVDAKSGEDLTRSILLQIILEHEAEGSPMLTEQVLANIIRFYGHAMQGFIKEGAGDILHHDAYGHRFAALETLSELIRFEVHLGDCSLDCLTLIGRYLGGAV